MKFDDRVYGSQEIDEPVILELIKYNGSEAPTYKQSKSIKELRMLNREGLRKAQTSGIDYQRDAGFTQYILEKYS